MKECKACQYTSAIHREAVEAELERLGKIKNLRRCKEAELERRLAVCGGCRHLDNNSVCMMCGCYVQIRAFLKDSRCPMKLW